MPILSSDLILYNASNKPVDDTSTGGGAIDGLSRPNFTQFTATAKITFQSTSASDSGNVTIVGRDSTGAIQTEILALGGLSETQSVNTYSRIHSVRMAASAIGTITVRQGLAGTTIATIPITERGFASLFQRAASIGSPITRYDKVFWYNSNASTTLTSAQVVLSADPAAVIKIGVALAKSDAVTIANRLTAPASIVFVDDAVYQNVPGTTLEAITGVGVWIEQDLAANNAAINNNFTLQLSGITV